LRQYRVALCNALNLLAVVIALAAVGCEGAIPLRGRVTEVGGAPITGAEVTRRREPPERPSTLVAVTDARGCFAFGQTVAPGVYEVAAEGFESASFTVPTLMQNRVRITLSRRGDGESSATLSSDDPLRECGQP